MSDIITKTHYKTKKNTNEIAHQPLDSYHVDNPAAAARQILQATHKERQIIAIGGGKGGVGKTAITSALGIGLSSFNYKVMMVDADFGGANLHTCMGIMEPEYSFYDFAFKAKADLNNIAIDTQIENLKLVCGPAGVLGGANPKYFQKRKYISQLKTLDADYILLDLGAGSSFNTIDFFLAADQGILITTPDSAAINETFNFLKICLMRRLVKIFKDNSEITNLLQTNFYAKNGQIHIPIPELIEKIKNYDIEAYFITKNFIEKYSPKLLLNMVRNRDDIKEGNSFQIAAKELLGLTVDFIGYLEYDQQVRKSSKSMIPFLLKGPQNKTSKNISKIITNGLLKKNGLSSINHRKKIIKSIKKKSTTFQNQQSASENICSVQCFYWDSCEYRNGGHPCVLRKLDPIFVE